MPEQLPDHTHCPMCDAAIPADEKFCSEKCKGEFDEASKRSRRRNNLFIAIVIVVVIVVGAFSLFL